MGELDKPQPQHRRGVTPPLQVLKHNLRHRRGGSRCLTRRHGLQFDLIWKEAKPQELKEEIFNMKEFLAVMKNRTCQAEWRQIRVELAYPE